MSRFMLFLTFLFTVFTVGLSTLVIVACAPINNSTSTKNKDIIQDNNLIDLTIFYEGQWTTHFTPENDKYTGTTFTFSKDGSFKLDLYKDQALAHTITGTHIYTSENGIITLTETSTNRILSFEAKFWSENVLGFTFWTDDNSNNVIESNFDYVLQDASFLGSWSVQSGTYKDTRYSFYASNAFDIGSGTFELKVYVNGSILLNSIGGNFYYDYVNNTLEVVSNNPSKVLVFRPNITNSSKDEMQFFFWKDIALNTTDSAIFYKENNSPLNNYLNQLLKVENGTFKDSEFTLKSSNQFDLKVVQNNIEVLPAFTGSYFWDFTRTKLGLKSNNKTLIFYPQFKGNDSFELAFWDSSTKNKANIALFKKYVAPPPPPLEHDFTGIWTFDAHTAVPSVKIFSEYLFDESKNSFIFKYLELENNTPSGSLYYDVAAVGTYTQKAIDDVQGEIYFTLDMLLLSKPRENKFFAVDLKNPANRNLINYKIKYFVINRYDKQSVFTIRYYDKNNYLNSFDRAGYCYTHETSPVICK